MTSGESSTADTDKPAEQPMDAATARALVFEHWEYLNAVAGKRFEWEDGLATAALDYAIGEMARDDWSRAREWKGAGTFKSFISTIALRLFADFDRQQNGYRRPPTWLARKADPVWAAAYRLLVIRRYEKREVVQLLATADKRRDRQFLEQVVAAVNGRCAKQLQRNPKSPLADPGPEFDLAVPTAFEELSDQELLKTLNRVLNGSNGPQDERSPLGDLNQRICALAKLTEEDRLILKLRYRDGLSVQHIKGLRGYDGDLYKRLKRMMVKLRRAIREIGMEP